MSVLFKNGQRSGKSLSVYAYGLGLIKAVGLRSFEGIYSNMILDIPDYHYIPEPLGIFDILESTFKHPYKHRLFLLQELGSIFPARAWDSKRQTEILSLLWKDEKYRNFIVGDCHLGTSIDIILREQARYVIIPKMDKPNDRIRWGIIDRHNHTSYEYWLLNASSYYAGYDTYS